MASLQFHKYQGTGNDFILIDNRGQSLEKQLTPEQIARMCHPKWGIGADGLMLLSDSASSDFRMIYYNSDGKESTMCGNGGRCIVDFAHQLGVGGPEYLFEAIDGLHRASWSSSQVALQMSPPSGYEELETNQCWIDTGSPHYVIFVDQAIQNIPVLTLGKQYRHDPRFAPGGTNVNFVEILGEDRLAVRTFERGVEAETLSCGTGVTACAYTHLLRTESSQTSISIQTPGGNLEVQIINRGKKEEEVWLKGPAIGVFEGRIPWESTIPA